MHESTFRNAEVLVIGAGMAGLCAARSLAKAGCAPVVVDKGRGIGGRLATRRFGGATFDHGAQFVTVREPRFERLIDAACKAGAAVEWCRGFHPDGDGHPRWRGKSGMSSLAKYVGAGLEIIQEKQVAVLRRESAFWRAEMIDGEVWTAGAVILTAPVPQSLALLDRGEVTLDSVLRGKLEALRYERCLAVMALLEGPSRLTGSGGLAPGSGPISWIADNHLKGVSALPGITIHATDNFSVAHWDEDRLKVGGDLLAVAREWIGAEVREYQVHGWRFSKPLEIWSESCAVASRSPLLVLAGDVFGGGRVEGAALSGWAAAEALLTEIWKR